MLRLICGRSGSGKTAYLTEQIRHDIENGKRCFLLVPEQQAYISERDLPRLLPQNAGLYFETVNFSSLAEDVFREYGGVTHTFMNAGLKSLLMWDTLRNLSPLLQRYGKSAGNDMTLTKLMLQTVEELRNDGISGEDLEKLSKDSELSEALQKKLSDLSLIDAAFRARVEEGFGSDPSDRLLRMASLLQKHRFFEGCNLYVDSFTDFTAPEYAVLREILRQADCVTVSLLADSFHSRLPHFESTVDTARRLQKLASQTSTEIEKIILESKTDEKPRPLVILERDLWNFEATNREQENFLPQERDSVRLLRCANLYEESEATALNILELIQNGLHYGDIAIVVRDVDTYKGVLDAALERYGIPYFLSERTDLTAKPLARLVLSALRAVSHHYRIQDIMTLVKTGLAGVSVADGSMLEEYCETWHITGSRFEDSVWSMNPDGLTTERSARADVILDAANRARKTVMEPLEVLATELRASYTIPERCRAVYDYLCRLHISETLSERAKAELEAGERRAAAETVRLYQFFTDTLATLCAIFPNTEVTVDEMISVLTILFSESDLGSVPDLHDCVMIGSASTLRVENIKASILLGLCEGEFPRAVTDDGLFTDADKEDLGEHGLILGSRSHMRSSQELLYVYRAITKPTQKLILSTVSAKTDGSELTPSLAYSRIRFLLAKKVEEFDASAVRHALGGQAFATVQPQQPLQAKPAEQGTSLRLSQSRLQTFMLCPYRYYCTYQLKLREQKDSRPNYADDGLFLHYVFEHFLKNACTESGELHIPDATILEQIANDILKEYLKDVCPIPQELMESRLLHLFARLRKLAIIMLYDILTELQHSLFVPTRFEQKIGSADDSGLPAVVLDLKNNSRVILSGVVDRIDVYKNEDKVYIRVVDYKSGVRKFSTEDVRSGLDIQLILYLFSVISSDPEHIHAAGAQYLYAQTEKSGINVGRSGLLLNDPVVTHAADTTDGAIYTKKLLLQTEEEIKSLIEEMNLAVKNAAERILAGEANKTPSEKACAFCPVRTHCDKAYHK